MPNLEIESQYPNQIIVGIDEAGRGPLSGPVVAAAVIIDQNYIIEGIRDSKKLSAKKRELLYKEITTYYQYGVGIISSEEIDKINILEATKKACILALEDIKTKVDIVLVDGNMKFDDPRFISIIKGDDKSLSIASASIIAKITRDKIMQKLSIEFPEYQWQKNSGYGTEDHLNAIRKHGYSIHHRKSFKVKTLN